MNNSQRFKIDIMYRIYKALYELSKETEDWDNLNKSQLMHGVMVKTNGHVNPATVEKAIEELQNVMGSTK